MNNRYKHGRQKYLHAKSRRAVTAGKQEACCNMQLTRHSMLCGAVSLFLLIAAFAMYQGGDARVWSSKTVLPAMAVQTSGPDEDSSTINSISSIPAEQSSAPESSPSSQPVVSSPPPPCPGEYPYQSKFPQMYCPEPVQTETKNTMYLTFDDGPSDNTSRILDILKQKNVKAAFFVVGKEGDKNRQLMKRIVDEGHTIGIHTYSHKYEEIYASVDAYLTDFNKIYNLIYDNTGVKPTIFRFPGGSVNSYNKAIRSALFKEMTRRRFYYYDWNVSCGDGSSKDYTKEQLTNNVLSIAGNKSRGVVLMHDSNAKSTTVDALPGIIDGLRAQGFTLEKLTGSVSPITM